MKTNLLLHCWSSQPQAEGLPARSVQLAMPHSSLPSLLSGWVLLVPPSWYTPQFL